MDAILDLTAAKTAVKVARTAIDTVRTAPFWKLTGLELLDLARDVEQLSRLLFSTQVAIAGELDTQDIATAHGSTSTAALLRQALTISAADARTRVATARATQPRDGVSGGELPPTLPLLGQALADGQIGIEQTRTIVASMAKIAPHVDDLTRGSCENYLVEYGRTIEPKPFADFAQAVVATCDPDGTLDTDDDRARKVELTLGTRNPSTGMTRFHGLLDDLGVEILSQAIDGLSAPRPATTDSIADNNDIGPADPAAPGATAGQPDRTPGSASAARSEGPARSHGPEAAKDTAHPNPSSTSGAGTGPKTIHTLGNSGGTGPRISRTPDNGSSASGGGPSTDHTPGGSSAGPAEPGGSTGTAGTADAGRDPIGATGKPVRDPRTPAQRRGQALIEALRRFLDLGQAPIQGGERPHVTVTIGLDELTRNAGVGYLDFGGAIDAGTARMLACDALLIPAVLAAASQVLDVGTAKRLFPQPIRRAIALRDKGCTFPGCDRPPAWCDCHHVQYWTDHGPSSYHNGVLLGPHHHTVIHREDWTIAFAPDGIPEFIPPPWVDPDRTPRRNLSRHLPTLRTGGGGPGCA